MRINKSLMSDNTNNSSLIKWGFQMKVMLLQQKSSTDSVFAPL